jgi:hypothetical protein
LKVKYNTGIKAGILPAANFRHVEKICSSAPDLNPEGIEYE